MATCMGQNPTFICMMFLTTSFFFVEIIVGYATNSMALVADSFHMLSDIISLFVGFFAMRYSKRSGGDISSNTFGWARAEVLGALVNAVFLVALCFSILVEAAKRLVEPEALENPNLILIVGAIGLLINLIGMFMFHGHTHGHSHGGGGGGHGHSHGGGDHGHGDGDEAHEEHEKHDDHKGHGHSHGNGGHAHSHGHENETAVAINKSDGINNTAFDNEDNIPNSIFIDSQKNENIVIPMNFKEEKPTTEEDKGDKKKKKKKVQSSSGQMNMRGVYLHILGDALGSVIVIIAALIIKYFDGKWTLYVDPGLSIIMVMIILKTSIPLLKESGRILLQNVPSHIELTKLEGKILEKFPEIVAVHEFHVWQLTGSRIVASIHIMCNSSVNYNDVSTSLKTFFHREGIHSLTVQPEFVDHDSSSENLCLLACPDDACAEKVCCKPPKSNDDSSSRSSSPLEISSAVTIDFQNMEETHIEVKDENDTQCSGNHKDDSEGKIDGDTQL